MVGIRSNEWRADGPALTSRYHDLGPGEWEGHAAHMRLRSLPVPSKASMVGWNMGPVLEAVSDGDLSRIRNVQV